MNIAMNITMNIAELLID